MSISSIIDDVFGGSKDVTDKNNITKSEQTGTVADTTKGTQTTNTTQQTGSVQANTSSTTSGQQSKNQTLSDEEIAAGDRILASMSGNFNPADLTGLRTRIEGKNDAASSGAASLFERAQGADSALKDDISNIIAEYQRKGELAIGKDVASISGQAGSAFNTLVQQTGNEGIDNLMVSLAAQKGQLNIQARQSATAELIAAVGALRDTAAGSASSELQVPLIASEINANNLGASSNLINALKGGVTTGSINSQQNTNGRTESQSTQNSISQILTDSTDTKNINLNTNSVSVGKETVDKNPSIFDILNSLKDK